MNNNIHVFARIPYWDTLYQAAESLPDDELRERVQHFEEVARTRESLPLLRRLLFDFYPGLSLILAERYPLIDPTDAYRAAREVLEFRQKDRDY